MKGHCYLNPPKVFVERHSLTSGEYIIRAISLRPEVDSEDKSCDSGRVQSITCEYCEFFREDKYD